MLADDDQGVIGASVGRLVLVHRPAPPSSRWHYDLRPVCPSLLVLIRRHEHPPARRAGAVPVVCSTRLVRVRWHCDSESGSEAHKLLAPPSRSSHV